MNMIKKAFNKFVVNPLQKAKKALALAGMAVGATLLSAKSASAAPNTGNTDIDMILTEFEGGFTTVKTGFVYLAVAAVGVTLVVVAFFWLRGKFKQSVSGA